METLRYSHRVRLQIPISRMHRFLVRDPHRGMAEIDSPEDTRRFSALKRGQGMLERRSMYRGEAKCGTRLICGTDGVITRAICG